MGIMIKLLPISILMLVLSGCSSLTLGKYDPADGVMPPPFLIKERAAVSAVPSVDITEVINKKENKGSGIQEYRDKVNSSNAAYRQRELDLIKKRDGIDLSISELRRQQTTERKEMKEKAKQDAYDIYKKTLQSLDSD